MSAGECNVRNVRVVECVLVGLAAPNTFAIVPHRNAPLKQYFFVFDALARVASYENNPVMFASTTHKRRKNVRVTDLHARLRDLTPEQFDGLDMVHAAMTIVDFVPDHLRHVVDKPQGPALTDLVFSGSETDRSDELAHLRSLGFDGLAVRHPSVSFRDLHIPLADLHATIPPLTPRDIEAAEREHAMKFERAINERFESLVQDGTVDKDFDPNAEVRVKVRVEHLRHVVVAGVDLVVQGKTHAIPKPSQDCVVAEFEHVVEQLAIAQRRRARLRKVPARSLSRSLDALKTGLFGPLRIAASQGSLCVAQRALSHVEIEDVDAIRDLETAKIRAPPAEYDKRFIDEMFEFAGNDRLWAIVIAFVEQGHHDVAPLARRRAAFLEAYRAGDERALAAAQRHERHFCALDDQFQRARDAWCSLAESLDFTC